MQISLYGLVVDVPVHLDGFPASEAAGRNVDVAVVIGHLGRPNDPWRLEPSEPWYKSRTDCEDDTPELEIRRSACGAYWWRYYDRTEFLVSNDGRQVHATWVSPLTLDDMLWYLFGPVLGFVLRIRGSVCLHGAAVMVGRHAVVIAGSQEAGKSTAIAALARRGLPVLTDDVAALSEEGGSFLVAPGPPRVMLLPESVEALWPLDDGPRRLSPGWDKHALDLTSPGFRHQAEPAPLGAVYFLDERTDDPAAPTFHDLSGTESLISLVSNTYANKMLDQNQRAAEFAALSRLVEHVPVRVVRPPLGLETLDRFCDGLLNDCRGLGLA